MSTVDRGELQRLQDVGLVRRRTSSCFEAPTTVARQSDDKRSEELAALAQSRPVSALTERTALIELFGQPVARTNVDSALLACRRLREKEAVTQGEAKAAEGLEADEAFQSPTMSTAGRRAARAPPLSSPAVFPQDLVGSPCSVSSAGSSELSNQQEQRLAALQVALEEAQQGRLAAEAAVQDAKVWRKRAMSLAALSLGLALGATLQAMRRTAGAGSR